MKKQTSLEDQLYIVGICLPVVVVFAWFLYRSLMQVPFFGMPCLLHTLTGYYCPGCGGTRAVEALLHMQLFRSFCYHPLVVYAAAVYLWFMVSQTAEKLSGHRILVGMHYHPGWLWASLVILVVNVIVKDGALLFFGVDLIGLVE